MYTYPKYWKEGEGNKPSKQESTWFKTHSKLPPTNLPGAPWNILAKTIALAWF